MFDGGRVDAGSFRLRDLFRTADPAGEAVAFRHAAYQEMLAAEFLRSPAGRDTALTAAAHPRLTAEVREFLHYRSQAAGPGRHQRRFGRLRGPRGGVPGGARATT